LEEGYGVSQDESCPLREAKKFSDVFESKAKQDLDGFHDRLENFGDRTQVNLLAVCMLTVTSAPSYDLVDALQVECSEHIPPAGKGACDSRSRRFQ
jgi:hypothetical protein